MTSRPTHLIRLATTALVAGILTIACGPAADRGQSPETADATSDTQAAADSQAASKIEYLLVQTAPSMRYEDGSLILESVNDMTLYFSDRPERITGYMTTVEHVQDCGSGDDSFASDPPNADLSILDGEESLQIVVVLTDPRFDGDDLIYDVEILEGEMPSSAGPSALFIDVVGHPLTPVSVAGVARRTSRRTARRVERRR
jgi:hypothetical protein